MFTSYFTAGLALVASAVAYTQPVGSPEGNPIYTPSLNQIIPAGQPFEITWDPTTNGTISLVLLKGPSQNAVAQYAIAEGLINSGYHQWTVAADLGSANTDGTGYGIQLIVDATGQYQYSTQFGIKNSGSSSGSSSAVSASSSAAPSSTEVASSTSCSTEASSAPATSSAAWTTSTVAPVPSHSAIYPSTNGTAPTKPASSSGSVPSSTGKPVTNGAGALATSFAGLVVAAGVAVIAF